MALPECCYYKTEPYAASIYIGAPSSCSSSEEKARAFTAKTTEDPNCAFNSVLKFFQCKREQIDGKEIAIGIDRNCVKSTKLFYDMADLQIPWAKIAGVKSINHA